MECVFQVVNMENGTRSPAMRVTRNVFADKLKELPDPEKFCVVVLMDQVKGEDVWDFSVAPLFNVTTFIKEFGSHE